jgi:undecaprenyl-diphosphatase
MTSFKSKFNFLPGIELKVLLAVLAIVLGTLGFILIAGIQVEGTADNIDIRILRALRDPVNLYRPIGPVWLYEVMRDITSLGGATIVFLITSIAIGYFIMRKEYASVFLVLAAVIGGTILDLELKLLFGRVRPMVVPQLVIVKTFSFPSGHSLMSTVVYLSLAALIAGIHQRKKDKIYILVVALFLTFIIGISRVYLGVHYPTDVLAGWSLGLAWAAICWYVSWRLFQNKQRKRITNNLH